MLQLQLMRLLQAIQVLVQTRNTHLLFAVRCNVDAGKGALAGEHGGPGVGGEGGKGGAALPMRA